MGYVTINNSHSFSKCKNGFQISPRMQELMVYAGQMDCYENCNEVIEKYLDITVSPSQVHRVTDMYGQEIGKTINEHTTLTLQIKLVFITDGAPWLRKWIEDAYGLSLSILDYYHACEYLHAFSREHFKDKMKEEQWIHKQKELLLEGGVWQVIKNVHKLNSSKKEAEKLIEYYRANADRMNYKDYLKTGCGIIGSGAIESAHRKVIQKRMKQSGQRWSKKGAQNMLNLRVINCNHQWEKIIELTKREFKNAA